MSKNEKVDDSKLEKQKVDLIVIGNQNSGKTSLIKRFVDDESNILITNLCRRIQPLLYAYFRDKFIKERY